MVSMLKTMSSDDIRSRLDDLRRSSDDTAGGTSLVSMAKTISSDDLRGRLDDQRRSSDDLASGEFPHALHGKDDIA